MMHPYLLLYRRPTHQCVCVASQKSCRKNPTSRSFNERGKSATFSGRSDSLMASFCMIASAFFMRKLLSSHAVTPLKHFEGENIISPSLPRSSQRYAVQKFQVFSESVLPPSQLPFPSFSLALSLLLPLKVLSSCRSRRWRSKGGRVAVLVDLPLN